MLASITPLGERSRGFSWRLHGIRVCRGAVASRRGRRRSPVRRIGLRRAAPGASIVALAILVVAVGFDATPLRRLPSNPPQVNEDWWRATRLGLRGCLWRPDRRRVATVVTSAAIYAARWARC